jgi:selenocysteine lyase/cysteine desulfurase
LLEGERLSPGGFHCFEHRWAVTAAVEYFEQIGKDAVFARIRELSDSLKRGLKTIAGVRVITPQSCEFSAGLVCFEIAGHGSHVVCSELEKRRILCSPAPYKKSFCRFSPFIYNSMDDIFKAIEAVREVSAQLCRKV